MPTLRLPTRVALAAAGSALVLGLAACSDGRPHGRGRVDDEQLAGRVDGPRRRPVTTTEADVMFSMMMVPHHLQAIEMSDLVPTRSTDPELLALARQIKAAQQPEVDTMTTWLASWGAEPMMGHEEDAPPGAAWAG